MLYPRKRLALSFLAISAAALLACLPSYGRRSVGTLESSSYGNLGGQHGNPGWELTPVATETVNGISISTETVCPLPDGGVAPSNPPCSTYAFLYRINSDAKNLVVTFSGLSRFPFITNVNSQTLGFGILICDPPPDQDPKPGDNMLCTASCILVEHRMGCNWW